MPIYEYTCTTCGRTTEALQRVDEAPLELCPHCGGALKKLLSAPAFQFKGSGWYVTDYARKGGDGKRPAAPSAEGPAASGGAAEGGATSPGKSESPPPAKTGES